MSVESGGFSRHELSEAGSRHVYREVAEILDQLYTGPLGQLLSESCLFAPGSGRYRTIG